MVHLEGSLLLATTIHGEISTNSNRELVSIWRDKVEGTLSSLPFPKLDRRKLSVSLKFWISSNRLQIGRNDLDNLVKPVLDSIKKIGIIQDDADIFHLEATKFPTNGEEEVHISVKDWN